MADIEGYGISGLFPEPKLALAQRHPAAVAHHDVIHELDIQETSRLDAGFSEAYVGLARSGIPAWVYVGEHDGAGVGQDGRAIDLGVAHIDAVDGAAVDERHVGDPVLHVEHERHEFFLAKILERREDLLHEEMGGSGGRLDLHVVVH